MVFFRSGHPRTLSPTRRRPPTINPCRHVVHPYYPTHHYRPNFHPSLGLVLFPLLFITLLPSFRLPLPYSYNPTHSIPSCYYLLDLVSSTQPLMCIISTRAARQCKHVFFHPHLRSLCFVFPAPHQSVSAALHFSFSSST